MPREQSSSRFTNRASTADKPAVGRGRFMSIALLIASFALWRPGIAVAQPLRPSPEAAQQIAALLAEKAARTPAQRKLSSRLR